VALTTRIPVHAARSRLPKPSAVTVATVAGFAVLLVGVLVAHTFFWGESQPLQTILDVGAIQCLHEQGWGALTAHCEAVGQPVGLTFLTGMPETMLGWAISWLPGVDAWTAHQILNVLLDAAAMAGGYLLLRRWDVVRGIALIAPAVYLVSPSVLGINGFQYTFTGFTFLPLYLYLFLSGIDRFEDEGRQWVGVAYLTGVTFLMVFTDGYSYATGLLLTGCVLIWWVVRNEHTSRNRKIFAVTTFAVANLVAVAAYTSYVNAPTERNVGLGAFRFLGLDPITLVIPPTGLWWPSHIGYHPPALHLWGDGSNTTHNYLGIVMLGLVAWLLLSRRLRTRPDRQRIEIGAFFVGACIALFLSLGPALKFDSKMVPITPPSNVPVSKTVVGLPTAFLYEHLPPFTAMRATYRWSFGTRFFVVFGSAYAASLVWRSGRRGVAVGLVALASLELLPPPNSTVHVARSGAAAVSAMRQTVMAEFDRLSTKGDRVLMLPSSNDFLANAMAPFAGVKAYNVGIDKSYDAAQVKWPATVQAAANGILNSAGQADRIAAVLQNDADEVVICYFSLLSGARMAPRPAPNAPFLREQAAALSRDPRLVTQQGTWMTVIRQR
jgi:hypothetical protein